MTTYIRQDIITNKLIRDKYVIRVSEYSSQISTDCDIEDLIDESTFDTLVKECYKKELRGKKLGLNNKIPRITHRYDSAFQSLGLGFNKTRIARLFLEKTSSQPDQVLSETTKANFISLFELINKKFNQLNKTAQVE